MVATVEIAGRKVGPDQPCFIIAEAGVNHDGNLDKALSLIDAASRSGADAVKFQTFVAARLVTRNAPKAAYQMGNTDPAESQYEMLRRLELSPESHRKLLAHCRQKEILFLSTPFDEESADLLVALGVAAFKVSSGEITNLPLLSHLARYHKPMIISTGMSCLSEVESAVRTVERAGNSEIVLLHCVSNYPASPADANLRAMATMGKALGVPVGYSDHTLGIEVAIAAVALGACVIEKHLTLDRTLPGPDQQASLEPDEMAQMVRSIRAVEAALGHGRKEPAASEAKIAAVARKSLFAARDIPAGTKLTEEMIDIKRPGTGLPPEMRPRLIGRTMRVSLSAGEPFAMEALECEP
jgi:N,N'-diacetyllegionaminate synthase